MRVFAVSSLVAGAGLAGLVGLTTAEPMHHMHEHENRMGAEWGYVPNYGYKCEGIGCCGKPTPDFPTKQACGPEFWKYISADTCERCDPMTGGQQSPINFLTMGNDSMNFLDMWDRTGGWTSDKSKADATPVFSNNLCQGKIELLTNTWEVSFDKACALHVDVLGQRWKLLQWHVHNTEHTINGLYYPLEVHMVHQNEAKDFLVVSMFLVSWHDRMSGGAGRMGRSPDKTSY
jgi:hypothetical protein